MLDTIQKVDQFLKLLRTEIINGQMSAGQYGPNVRVEIKQEAGYGNFDDAAHFFAGTIRKTISVEIIEKPKTSITSGCWKVEK